MALPVVDPYTAQLSIADKYFGSKNRSTKAEAAHSAYVSLYNDPEYKRLVNEGKIEPLPGWIEGGDKKAVWNYNNIGATADRVKAAQKKESDISVLWETFSGTAPDTETINKYYKYADDPAMLQVIMQKQAAQAPSAGKYNSAINEAVQSKIGRAATQAELQYFGKQMESGNLDPYTLNTFIENTPEYQTKASTAARGKLTEELKGVDTSYMGDVEKALQRQYSAQRRSGSSAFGSALIKSGQDLAKGRTEYLAGLGYQDFLRGQGALRSDYENALQRQYAGQQQNAALGQESRQRYYAQQDWNRQIAEQERLRRASEPKQGSFMQALLPGLITGAGAVIGGSMGNPQAGAAIGSSVGSMYNRNPKMNLYGGSYY